MRKLCVKLDRIAGLRQLRDSLEPDPVSAAVICELNGADSVSVRIRPEQSSIQPRDIKLLRQMVQTQLNLEIPNRQDYLTMALKYKPDMLTIIPTYKDGSVMHNGIKINRNLQDTVDELRKTGMNICLLLDPDPMQIKQAIKLDIQAIEICIGNYTLLKDKAEINKELTNIWKSAELIHQAKLTCAVGHGLDYQNIKELVKINEIREFRIGYALVARAIFTGLDRAIRDLRLMID
ncbi:MAG: pyridoxine 5'-phosphate synthase [Candidatus Stygibacter australis]|nr:pyridoxine 5'-phosphate synthase [Candidatus Stygibacter australis]MDP8322512.1 pyridoxine 5'-phosphate synthase [Candidatus Stygibacter australis]